MKQKARQKRNTTLEDNEIYYDADCVLDVPIDCIKGKIKVLSSFEQYSKEVETQDNNNNDCYVEIKWCSRGFDSASNTPYLLPYVKL